MKNTRKHKLNKALNWCTSILGKVEVLADCSKVHGGHESSTCLIKTNNGPAYLKLHETISHWNNEVYAYENWVSSFDSFAPRLLAVRDEDPLSLVISVLPGKILEKMKLSPNKEQALWHRAGNKLASLHKSQKGDFFGPCLRNGTGVENFSNDAVEYVSNKFNHQIETAITGKYINKEELEVIQAAFKLIGAFKGEVPVPCHRDYCPANWLVDENGDWTGVIDFEFSHWDVTISDFSRYPDWEWINRPDLIEAFFSGYGRALTVVEHKQLLVAHTEYALSAIIWGRDNSFSGFEQEGRISLQHLAKLVSLT